MFKDYPISKPLKLFIFCLACLILISIAVFIFLNLDKYKAIENSNKHLALNKIIPLGEAYASSTVNVSIFR